VVALKSMALLFAIPHLNPQCVMRPTDIAGYVLALDHACSFGKRTRINYFLAENGDTANTM